MIYVSDKKVEFSVAEGSFNASWPYEHSHKIDQLRVTL